MDKTIAILFTFCLLAATGFSSPFKSYTKRNLFGPEQMTYVMFKYGDTNRSGTLSANEIKSFYRHSLGYTEEGATTVTRNLFQAGDTNKNNELEPSELLVALEGLSDVLQNSKF